MNNSFLMIEYDLLQSNLTSDEKIILSLIKSWNDDNKQCFMSNPAIAQLIGLQPKNVSKKINKLKNLGLISITQIYRKNTKQIEKRILKFICYPTPPEIVDTPSTKTGYPSTIVDTPPQKREVIKLDIKLEDKIKDNNNITPVILGEFGNEKENTYICNTNNDEEMKYTQEQYQKYFEEYNNITPVILGKFGNKKENTYILKNDEVLKNDEEMKYTQEQYQKYFEEYKKQNAYKLGIKIQDEIPLPKKVDGFVAKQNLVDIEYQLQNEFYKIDKNLLFEYIKNKQEDRLPLIMGKQLTMLQQQLCEKYREMITQPNVSEE